jgi:hypothetical protein
MRRVVWPLAALSALACASPPPEQGDWALLESRRLVLHAQLAEPRAREILAHLEAFRAAVEAAVGIRAPSSPRVRVVVFEGPRRAGGILAEGWARGFVASLADGDVLVTSRDASALPRLYVEGMLSGRSPYWYAQGMAALLSTLQVEQGAVTLGVPPKGYARKRPATTKSEDDGEEKKEVTGLTLITDEAFKPGVEERDRDYWLLTHYLLLASPERANGLREYLRLWQAGVPSPDAFAQAIGRPADALYREEVARYAERGVKTLRVPLAEPAPESEIRTRPPAAGEVEGLLAALRSWQSRREPPPERKR